MNYRLFFLLTFLIPIFYGPVSAQEEKSKRDSLKKTYRPFYLMSEDIEITYGPASWYSLRGSLTMGKSGNTLTLSGDMQNLTRSSQSYKDPDQSKVFDHYFGYSNLYSPSRGVNSKNNVSAYYQFKREKFELALSYTFEKNKKELKDTVYREYLIGSNGVSYFRGSDELQNINSSHDIYMNIMFTPGKKDKNRIFLTTKLNLPENIHRVFSLADNFSATDTVVNTARNNFRDTSAGYKFSSSIVFNHSLKKSYIWFKTEAGDEKMNYTSSFSSVYDYALVPDTLDMSFKQNYTKRFAYGTIKHQLTERKISWPTFGFTYSYYEISSFRYLDSSEIILPDSLFTNKMDVVSISMKPEMEWRRTYGEKIAMSAKVYYEILELTNSESFPSQDQTKRKYKNLFSELNISFPLLKDKPLVNISYTSSPDRPDHGQLQPYRDNTTAFVWSTGNSQLQQAISHKAVLKYTGKGNKKGFTFQTAMEASYTSNPIRTSAVMASSDTLLPYGWKVSQGTLFYTYRNFSYEKKIDGNFAVEIPVKKLRSKLILTPLFNYILLPSSISDNTGNMEQTKYSGRISWRTNLKYAISFSLNYWQDHITLKSDILTSYSGKYNNRTAFINLNWRPKKKNILGECSFIVNTFEGLEDGYDQVLFLLSPKITWYRYKEKRMLIDIEFFDLLNQNKYFQRNVTPFYIEDRISTAMGRTVLIHFKYQPGVLNKKQIERKKADF